MKIILIVLIAVGFVICEVPPPYPSRGFRPSPPFNLPSSNFNQRPQPQTTYGAPNATPSKFTLPSSPQTQYGVPNTRNVESLGIRSNFNSASNVSPTIPSTSYGVPITDNGKPLQNNVRIVNSLPQTTYGVPSRLNNNVNRPQTQYGTPDTRDLENLEQIRQLNLLLQLRQSSKSTVQNQIGTSFSQSQNANRNIIPTEQYLPVKDAINFRGEITPSRNPDLNFSQFQNSGRNIEQPTQQYLPIKNAENFRKGLEFPQGNVPQRQTQNVPGNIGLSPNTPDPRYQLNNPASQYQPSQPNRFNNNVQNGLEFPQGNVPQRQAQNFPGNTGLSPNTPDPRFNLNNPVSQYQPSQPNRFNNNAQNGNNAGGPSQQYVPSKPSSSFGRSENRPNGFSAANQNIPANFNQQPATSVNTNIPQFPNGNTNNFAKAKAQSDFDIQQADVRTLSPSQGNRNNNAVPSQAQFPRPSLPAGANGNFGRSNSQGTEEETVDEAYLPPTTTARAIHRQINRPKLPSRPTEAPVQQEESTESDAEAGGPNIAVSTAVAGAPGGQSFYLLQPDGRLQRVIYQKTREEGDQENEYTANYLFQNIQADPSLVYSPLITLGK